MWWMLRRLCCCGGDPCELGCDACSNTLYASVSGIELVGSAGGQYVCDIPEVVVPITKVGSCHWGGELLVSDCCSAPLSPHFGITKHSVDLILSCPPPPNPYFWVLSDIIETAVYPSEHCPPPGTPAQTWRFWYRLDAPAPCASGSYINTSHFTPPTILVADPGIAVVSQGGDAPEFPGWVGTRKEACRICTVPAFDCWIKTLCCKEKQITLDDPDEFCPLGFWNTIDNG